MSHEIKFNLQNLFSDLPVASLHKHFAEREPEANEVSIFEQLEYFFKK